MQVVALEPPAAMRREARRANPHPLVLPVAGRAEALHLGAARRGTAWLSTVIHHVDLERSACELRPVLRDGAPLLVRSAFPGREAGITLARYFPVHRRLAQLPSIEQTAEVLGRAGFACTTLENVAQESASSLEDFARRVRGARHADSLLASLADAEYEAGLAALERDVASGAARGPVIDRLTVLFFR